MKRSSRVVLFLMVVLALASLALAQSISGDLVGTIYDPTGAGIPGATITATNIATGITATTTSTSTGQYRLGNLAVGAYKLTVSATGFAKAEVNNVPVELNKAGTANVTLQVGETSTVVEVAGTAVTIDTTTAQVQTTFETRQLADLPIASVGSGVINLALLSAGVGSSGAVGVGTGPSVGGQRPRNNNFTIEGIDNNSKSVTGPLVYLPNDAVAEFTMLSNQFSPEYGHSTGGQFNQILKSGGNEFHGVGYEYLQNRNLNAADQLSIVDAVDPHPRYDNNRFGGNIGGPIKRNKLFFLFGYEYEPIGKSGSPGQIFAPTQAGYTALASISGVSSNNLAVLKQYLPPVATAVDPSATPNGAYPVVAGKTIEVGQMSVLSPSFTNYSTYYGSVDYNISEKDSLRGRIIVVKASFIDTAASLPVFFTMTPNNNYLATFSEFHNFSPRVTNEFRLGYNRNYNVYTVGSQTFPGLDAFPNITVDELGVNIGPDPNSPQGGVQNTYQATDNISWSKGRHSLKFGIDFHKLIAPQFFTQRARGDYEWDTLENYLTDQIPYFGERTTGNFEYYGDQTLTGLYANDDIKVRPDLTINIGLRYERTTVPYAERLQTVNSISSVPGLITFGEPKVFNKGFMPRIGFAWAPGTRGNTSIRGGFGMGYDQLFDNLGLLSMAPQFQQTVDVGGSAGGNFLANGGIKPNVSSGTLSQADARRLTGGFVPDQKPPKAIQWNLGVQHVFKENYSVEVRYLGTRGLDLPVQDRLNVQAVVTPQNALPLYLQAPSQSTLNGLTSTLAQLTAAYNAHGYYLPQYWNAGFQSNIVGFMPMGSSTYHGLALQVTRRFANGLQFVGAYTWSHNIDDSTAEVFSTYTTPRRPYDFQNLRLDRSDSALDHRQRFTFTTIYDLPFFKHHSSWFMKNLVGNWEFAPIFTYQTGTWATVQSSIDSNLNGDSAGDRTYINPAGTVNVGSGVTALTNSSGATVAYLVKNPNARYIQTPKGVLPNAARNTEHLMPIDDLDLSVVKRFNITEHKSFEFGAQFTNFLNHPQYTGGYLNDVAPIGFTGANVHNFLNPTTTTFYQPAMVFSSNPRTLQVSAKFKF
ncbi:MAG: TonB-dependent receptor [Bryobacteraceae bacterium]